MKKLSFFIIMIAMMAIASPYFTGCSDDSTGLGVNNVSSEMVHADIKVGQTLIGEGETVYLDSGGPVNFSDNDPNSTSRTWRMFGNNPNTYTTRDVTHIYSNDTGKFMVSLVVHGPVNSDSTYGYIHIGPNNGGSSGPRGEHFMLYAPPYFNPANGKFVYPTGYNKLWFTGSNSSSPFVVFNHPSQWVADTMGVDSIMINQKPYWTKQKQMWDTVTEQSYGGYGSQSIPLNQWQYAALDSSTYFGNGKLRVVYFGGTVNKWGTVTIPLPGNSGDGSSNKVVRWESTPTTYRVYLYMNNVTDASGFNPWFLIYKNSQWVTPNNQEVTTRAYQTNGSGWYVIEISKSYITTLGTYTRIRFGCENTAQNNIDANYNGSIYAVNEAQYGGWHLRMPFVGM